MTSKRAQIILCGGSRCARAGSTQNKKAFENELKKHHLENEVEITVIGCLRLCEMGPMVFVFDSEGTCYTQVQPVDVAEIVEEHLINGRPLKRLEFEYRNSGVENAVPGFYNDQQRVESTVNRLQNLKEK